MKPLRQSASLIPQPPVEPAFSVESGLFSLPDHNTVHAIFAPLHYERGYSYPLVVWLHGPGGNERQLLRIMPMISMRNYVAVAPRGTLLPAAGEGSGGNLRLAAGRRPACSRPNTAFSRASRPSAQRFHIASQRIFLAGFDCRRDDGFSRGDEPPGAVRGRAVAGRSISQRLLRFG